MNKPASTDLLDEIFEERIISNPEFPQLVEEAQIIRAEQIIVKSTFTLDQMDAFEWLKKLPNNCATSIITDPPYSSLERHRKTGSKPRLQDKWFNVIPNESFPELFEQFYRILEPNSHLYMMCDAETMFVIKPMGEAAGFKFWKPIVVNLMNISMGYHYRNQATYVLFFEKGKRRLNDLGISDVIEAKRIRGGYATEKPVKISEVLIKQSSNEHDLIIDPFMGSGSTGVAALTHNRNFFGNDLSSVAFKLASERLQTLRPKQKIRQ